MSKQMVTKVDIVVSDDGGKCDPSCRHLDVLGDDPLMCTAFGHGQGMATELEKAEDGSYKRCIGCMAREDVTYQIPIVEE